VLRNIFLTILYNSPPQNFSFHTPTTIPPGASLSDCPHLRFKLVLTLVRYQSFYITLRYFIWMAAWLSGNIVGHIYEVTLRRAGLVLRWVNVRVYTVLVFNQATHANSAWPSLLG